MSEGMFGFYLGLTIGLIAGTLIVAFGVNFMIKRKKFTPPKKVERIVLGLMMFGLLSLALAVGNVATAYAQSTPVPLVIPTDVIFSETNNWMAVFAPIAAIGIGISIALAVLNYLGKMIKGAFG